MKNTLFLASIMLIVASCNNSSSNAGDDSKDSAIAAAGPDVVPTTVDRVHLPEPFATKSVKNYTKVIGWPDAQTPTVPEGFVIKKFADSLDNPRWIYVADNGDIFIAESNSPHNAIEKATGKNKSADRITMFRDDNGDGIPEVRSVFLKGLDKPFGMLVADNIFYVANTGGIVQFAYTQGATSITTKGRAIMSLPPGPRHWTKNIVTNADRSKIYVAIGSASDHAEDGIDKETRRATILEANMDGTGEKVYASGLRNPVGMAWAPGTQTLWTAVNERDELGDELVPDYLTSVQPGGFYGWPYSYFGDHPDPRLKDKQQPELVKKAIVPDVPLGSHTASLGLAFYTGKAFPERFQNGAFIGQHGSWNSSILKGYRVVFVPFKAGKPTGMPEDFVTGFIANDSKGEVYGRPVGVAVTKDGSLLVADDAGKKIWWVSAKR
jgi:glucose/arabinose dehydrogenase